jgi:hypothetical protein
MIMDETNELGFGQIVIDCRSADKLADFWATLLRRDVDPGASDFYAFIPASADRTFPALMFLQVPEPRAGKNRWHLDLFAADPAAQVQRALELGAAKLGDYDEYGAKWTTLADPEGNVFDIAAPHD